MSDLVHSNSEELLLHETGFSSSDSDSEDTKTAGNESNGSPNKILEMGDKCEKPGRLPLPLGNTTIETPTNFALTLDARSGSAVGKRTDSVSPQDFDVKYGSLNLKNIHAGNRSGSFNVQQEKLAKIDSQLSTSPQRKLPIPNMAVNTNPNLKGILIKPKRILPAKPDHLKVKSAQIRQSSKDDDKLEQGLSLAGDVVLHGQTESDFGEKQLTNSPPDVDKIKTYFRKHGPELIGIENNGTEDSDLSPDYVDQTNAPVLKSENESGYLTKDGDTVCVDLKSPVNQTKTEEWKMFESDNKEENNNKMTSDTNVPRSLERGIRSPSPKSNTTWDRSSSGYSSDERPDPRSPPPVSSAGTSSKHSLDNDDEILIPEIEAGIASLTGPDKQLQDTGGGSQEADKTHTESAILDRDNVTPENCSHTLSVTPQPTRCVNCDIMSKTKTDLSLQTHSSAFDSVIPGARQLLMQKPSWTPPAKIQYRKSASEAMINLRYPGKQTAPDTHGGLEVLGKSYRQQSNITAPASQDEGENAGRSDIPTPGSGTGLEDGARESDLSLDLTQVDTRNQEATKTRLIRQQLMTLRSPRDMKMNMNGR